MRKLANKELNRLDNTAFRKARKIPLVVILDNVRSMHNVGSIFRSADAFRIEALYLCGITARPPHRDIHKTALGATETVVWKYFSNAMDALRELKEKEYKVYAIEQADRSVSLEEFSTDFSTGLTVIFGHEITGVGEEVIPLVDGCIEIPQYGTKHSLNIAVSAGIVIWKIFQDYLKFDKGFH